MEYADSTLIKYRSVDMTPILEGYYRVGMDKGINSNFITAFPPFLHFWNCEGREY